MSFSMVMELQRAWRRLFRAPGFSLSVIVLFALSVGGAAAIATAGWSLFARPLPYSRAHFRPTRRRARRGSRCAEMSALPTRNFGC